ncbi:MAG: hypothetical protein E6R13_02645 [Spirochaetes bacterium]|nr:MAG: hypothetical protein E6R13_02645 [Spirochaetota bacterium]
MELQLNVEEQFDEIYGAYLNRELTKEEEKALKTYELIREGEKISKALKWESIKAEKKEMDEKLKAIEEEERIKKEEAKKASDLAIEKMATAHAEYIDRIADMWKEKGDGMMYNILKAVSSGKKMVDITDKLMYDHTGMVCLSITCRSIEKERGRGRLIAEVIETIVFPKINYENIDNEFDGVLEKFNEDFQLATERISKFVRR